jgi:3-O-methylgallate 3,4-dioxygenase
MAEIVLGLASSHSPQLSTPPDLWPAYGQADRNHTELWAADGKPYSFDQLLERPDRVAIERELDPEKQEARYNACQKGIAALGEALEQAAPDVVVMIGDDQLELFSDENMPAVLVYWGDAIRNVPANIPESAPAHRKASTWGWFADREIDYPVASGLGRHLIEYLVDQDFDVSHSRRLQTGRGMGHAFGYLYQRVLRQNPIPTVPIMVNTYYPPNQVSPRRCYRLGQAVRAAVQCWEGDARVAVIASGGLSHFVIDEDLDHRVILGLKDRDTDALFSLPPENLNSGNSEIRNWIAAAGAVEHLDMELVDYVPCYRSPAGTGCAMGFARWT